MILPIYVIGTPVLRKVAEDITPDYEGLEQLLKDMEETMYHSDGVGLAAPQIGKSIRIFIIDASPMDEDDESLKDFKKVFINPKIIEFRGERSLFNEGCLSIPTIREDVERESEIRIQYYDENFKFHDEVFDGIKARIIQHEYDHLEGILFTDRLNPLKKRLLKGKLTSVSKGKVDVNYRIKTP
jgi:peptide deformylase